MEDLLKEFVEDIQKLKDRRLEISRQIRTMEPESKFYRDGLELVGNINQQIRELIRKLADKI